MNGREYSDPRDLPPDLRAAYEKAMQASPGGEANNPTGERFVINGQEFESEEAMPPDVRRLCHDIMSVIETNGEVTLPASVPSAGFLTNGRSLLFVGLTITVAAAVYLFLHYAR